MGLFDADDVQTIPETPDEEKIIGAPDWVIKKRLEEISQRHEQAEKFTEERTGEVVSWYCEQCIYKMGTLAFLDHLISIHRALDTNGYRRLRLNSKIGNVRVKTYDWYTGWGRFIQTVTTKRKEV